MFIGLPIVKPFVNHISFKMNDVGDTKDTNIFNMSCKLYARKKLIQIFTFIVSSLVCIVIVYSLCNSVSILFEKKII